MSRIFGKVAPLGGAALLALTAVPGSAFGHGGEPPKNPVTAQGKPQLDPRPGSNRGDGLVMEADQAEPKLFGGKLRAMDVSARVSAEGPAMPALTREAQAPKQGAGRQQGRKAGEPTAERHLHLVLRVTEGDGAEVVHATELAGRPAVDENAEGAFVYEVSVGGKILSVQSISDPFEIRSFPRQGVDPEHGGGHSFARAKSANIAVRVPGLSLQRAQAEDVTFTLYRAKEQLTGRLSAATVEQLKRDGKIERAATTVGRGLSNQIVQKGQRLDH